MREEDGSAVALNDGRVAKPGREAEPQGLLARVEAAAGPDRELDAALCVTFDERPEWLARSAGELWAGPMEGRWPQVRWRAEGMKRSSGNPSLTDEEIRPYTASLDAALALVTRVAMPEPDFDICFRQMGRAGVRWFVPERGHWLVTEAATPALSVCAALLKALIAEAASPTERQPQIPG